MSRAYLRVQRQRRREHKAELKVRRIREARVKRIWLVSLSAIPMPAWAADRRIPGLSFGPSTVWLRPSDARFLLARDRECGGTPRFSETEYRPCPVCHRPLLGAQAAERRRLDESCNTGRQLPCGEDCIEASKDRRWKRLDT